MVASNDSRKTTTLAARNSVPVHGSKKATHVAAVCPICEATITIVSFWCAAYKPLDLRFEHLPRVIPGLLLATIERQNRTKLGSGLCD